MEVKEKVSPGHQPGAKNRPELYSQNSTQQLETAIEGNNTKHYNHANYWSIDKVCFKMKYFSGRAGVYNVDLNFNRNYLGSWI